MAQCQVCKKKIRGRIYRWHHKIMDKKCYQYFTGNVHVVRSPRVPNRPKSGPKPRSLWKRLFG